VFKPPATEDLVDDAGTGGVVGCAVGLGVIGEAVGFGEGLGVTGEAVRFGDAGIGELVGCTMGLRVIGEAVGCAVELLVTGKAVGFGEGWGVSDPAGLGPEPPEDLNTSTSESDMYWVLGRRYLEWDGPPFNFNDINGVRPSLGKRTSFNNVKMLGVRCNRQIEICHATGEALSFRDLDGIDRSKLLEIDTPVGAYIMKQQWKISISQGQFE